MDAICIAREVERSQWEARAGGQPVRGQAIAWSPYIDRFQRDYGWRPSVQTMSNFNAALRNDPLFYANYPMETHLARRKNWY